MMFLAQLFAAAFLLSVDGDVFMVDVKMIVNADLVVCFFVTVDISFVVGEKVIGSVEHSVEINIGYSNEYYILCKQFT